MPALGAMVPHLPLARFLSSCSGVRLATPRDPRAVLRFLADEAPPSVLFGVPTAASSSAGWCCGC